MISVLAFLKKYSNLQIERNTYHKDHQFFFKYWQTNGWNDFRKRTIGGIYGWFLKVKHWNYSSYAKPRGLYLNACQCTKLFWSYSKSYKQKTFGIFTDIILSSYLHIWRIHCFLIPHKELLNKISFQFNIGIRHTLISASRELIKHANKTIFKTYIKFSWYVYNLVKEISDGQWCIYCVFNFFILYLMKYCRM